MISALRHTQARSVSHALTVAHMAVASTVGPIPPEHRCLLDMRAPHIAVMHTALPSTRGMRTHPRVSPRAVRKRNVCVQPDVGGRALQRLRGESTGVYVARWMQSSWIVERCKNKTFKRSHFAAVFDSPDSHSTQDNRVGPRCEKCPSCANQVTNDATSNRILTNRISSKTRSNPLHPLQGTCKYRNDTGPYCDCHGNNYDEGSHCTSCSVRSCALAKGVLCLRVMAVTCGLINVSFCERRLCWIDS